MNECICVGNFRQIVKESEPFFDKIFVDSNGVEWRFYGVVWSNDDLYYGMSSCITHAHKLLSCVGSIEGHGFSLKESE